MPGESGGAGVVQLHRSRFVEWQPSGVVALAASGDGSVVVAAREDGDLELYETSTNHCFQRIPGQRDSCLTCVALVDEQESKGCLTSRLFSGGLDGAIMEWDVEHRLAGQAVDSLGGAAWQLVPEPGACITPDSPARIAVACDDGCARIFQAEAGTPGLLYSKTLPRVEGRTLAVAWHPSGNMLATAGTDRCIHLWSIDSGHEVLRITAGDGSSHGAEACIWALLVLPDGTVVSGDSAGHVQFWDGRNGTLLAAFMHHQADVLQLAASPDGSMVFAAGVDPQIALFQRLRESGSSSSKEVPWAFLSSKRTHSHDVRAMCIAAGRHVAEGARLFTGGNDTQLFSHSVEQYLQEHPVRMNACPQLPLLQATCSTANSSNGQVEHPPWLLCAQRSEVDVWQLPLAGSQMQLGTPAEGMLLSASKAPEHMLRLVLRSGRHINAACISTCGRWLAYSDPQRVSCFSLVQRPADELVPSNHIMPAPLQLLSGLPPASHLAFRPDSSQLITCGSDGTIHIVDVTARQPQRDGFDCGSCDASGEVVQAVRAVHDIQYKASSRRDRQRSAARRLMPAVELMAVSPDGSWLAVTVRQRVHLLSLETHKLVHSLPPMAEPQPPITALAFTADSNTLVVAASTHQIAAYDVQHGRPTEWCQTHMAALPCKMLNMPGSIVSITSSPAAPSSLFLASSEACCHIDIEQLLDCSEHGDQGRKRRRGALKPTLGSEPPGGNCRMIYCSDPVLYATYLHAEALLAVERPWQEVLSKVVAPMYRHRFGT